MIIKELDIKGVYLLKSNVHSDERGSFRRSFCQETMNSNGLDANCQQGNLSYNPKKGTLRGFHYQEEPYGENKTITCITGSIYDIVVDLRKDSQSYKKWISIELYADVGNSLYVPRGCANAWLTTTSNTIIHYYMGNKYVPEAGKGIRYNDPSFKFMWPEEIKIISNKDTSYPNFDYN